MKCNYNGCSKQCSGEVNESECNILRAFNKGKECGRDSAITDFKSELLALIDTNFDNDDEYITVGEAKSYINEVVDTLNLNE